MNGVSMPAVAAAGVGALFIWSGIRGAKVSTAARDILSGKQPSSVNAEPIASGSSSNSAGTVTTITDSAIANTAQRYQGHPYLFGGAPGTDGTHPWDCSSFCNWVLGHDLKLAIPGVASYSGTSHGPTTLSYLSWSGAKTVGHSANAAIAGDLLVWQTHMGISLGNGRMISALNPSLGTRITTVAGGSPGAELLYVRRLKAAR